MATPGCERRSGLLQCRSNGHIFNPFPCLNLSAVAVVDIVQYFTLRDDAKLGIERPQVKKGEVLFFLPVTGGGRFFKYFFISRIGAGTGWVYHLPFHVSTAQGRAGRRPKPSFLSYRHIGSDIPWLVNINCSCKRLG